MSVSTLPHTRLTLHGIAEPDGSPEQASAPAILFKLSESLLEDVKKASHVHGGLQFVTGTAPKIRLGKRTIDLTISPEAFRHELYSASTESLGDLAFAGLVSHRAELALPERKQSIGSDAALAALQSSLALHEQEKQAKSVNISTNVVAEPKNRWEAAKEQKQARRRGLLGQQHASPSLSASSASRQPADSTSFPSNDTASRPQAMRTPLIHLLAMRPLSREDLRDKTRIPREDLDEVLTRVAKEEKGRWQLVDRAYKELTVWEFGYRSQEERQAAIDNAIRAYDRLRLGKDEKIWQQLLPKEDRDKGFVLSKLHLGGAVPGKGNISDSPLPPEDEAGDGNVASAANTPRQGTASTPKLGAARNNAGGLSKRLFAKDPKKQRAADDIKERKRKEREAASVASDREEGRVPPARKKHTTKANNPKAKSAEFVQSSSEESDGGREAGGGISATGKKGQTLPGGSSLLKAPADERKPATNAAVKARPKPMTNTASATGSPSSNNAPAKAARPRVAGGATPKIGTSSTSSRPTTSTVPTKQTPKPVTTGKSTPNGLSAPTAQHRSQHSPKKPTSRPSVPSPLGAARPRVASDVSDRGALGVQRVRQGAETPKGLGITNGYRSRHDTVTSSDSYLSSRSNRMNGDHSKSVAERPRKPTTNGTAVHESPLTNDSGRKDDRGVKRKAVDSPVQKHDNTATLKHRKTESTSSNSQSSTLGANGTNGVSQDRGTSSDSVSSIINDITYSQGVNIAQKFREEYYPRYAKLYDEQLAVERRGETVSTEDRKRLWDMHRRLEQMKREIKAASQREHLDE